MSKLTEQWIAIFRAGNYGDKGDYSERDLDQIVANYDPTFHEAPACIGHPANDLPAYGWVESLRREGNTLFGKLKDVQPAFEEMVQKKLFKKRSIGLYQTDKGLALRHVGFLGAQPPEIKGLADVQFNDQGKTVIEFTEEDSEMAGEQQTFMDQLKAFFAGRESVTIPVTPAKTFSEADVQKLVADALKPMSDELTKIKADAQVQAATFAEKEAKLAQQQLGAAASAKVAELKAQGKWIPAFDQMGVPKLFSELAKSTVTIEFGEGDKKENVSLLDSAAKIFGALPKIVPPGTVVQPGTTTTTATFSENKGSRSVADPNSVQLSELAKTRAKEKKIDFAEALNEIVIEHPELTAPGGSSAGKV